METQTRERLGWVLALLLATGVALDIAQGEWLWAALVGAAGSLLVLARVAGTRFAGSCLLLVWCGYWLGNRGFAQLSPSARLPLFPAELALLVLAGWMVWRMARTQRFPVPLGAAELWLLGWLALGTVRFLPSLPRYGFEAVRDFATVYYGAFFFFALAAQAEAPLLNRFDRALRVCSAALIPLFAVFRLFPDFFTDVLVVRGNPLLYYKDDLVGTFLAGGALAHYLHFRRTPGAWGSLVLTLLSAGAVVATHNRASMLGLAAGVILLALRGRAGLLAWLGGAAAAAGLALGLALATDRVKWEDTPGPAVLDLVASVVDVEGSARYRSAETEFKGDNNRFRTVWWSTVAADTWREGPWLGVGFGYDLAARFLDVYYPDSNDDFTARSPHSIFMTVFARLGLVGLAVFLGVVALLFRTAWQTLTVAGHGVAAVPGLVAVAVLTSGSLGVVLEGPMGAVIFWSAFGLARAAQRAGLPKEANKSHTVTSTTAGGRIE